MPTDPITLPSGKKRHESSVKLDPFFETVLTAIVYSKTGYVLEVSIEGNSDQIVPSLEETGTKRRIANFLLDVLSGHLPEFMLHEFTERIWRDFMYLYIRAYGEYGIPEPPCVFHVYGAMCEDNRHLTAVETWERIVSHVTLRSLTRDQVVLIETGLRPHRERISREQEEKLRSDCHDARISVATDFSPLDPHDHVVVPLDDGTYRILTGYKLRAS